MSDLTQRQRAEALLKLLKRRRLQSDAAKEKVLYDAIQEARQEALREAAERLDVGDSNGLLAAPCLWCGYNGEGYYQAGTHGQSCPWNTIGGCDERLDRLAREGVR